MKLYFLFITLLLTAGGLAAENSYSAETSRDKANKLRNQGNWKDALKIDRELLERVDDGMSWKDLENALQQFPVNFQSVLPIPLVPELVRFIPTGLGGI
jgi:hypothetical protein